MTIDSFQIAFLSVTLLLPGYVASLVLSSRRARRRDATEIEVFRWLALGAVCNAPWLVIVFLAAGDALRSSDLAWDWAVDHRSWVVAGWLVAVFLWPLLIGEALARFQAQRVTSPRSGATAWDAKFIEIEHTNGDWVLIMLKDGGWIAGQYAAGSFASIEPGERDVYISSIHYTSFDTDLPGLGAGGGVLVPADQIRYIRFWN